MGYKNKILLILTAMSLMLSGCAITIQTGNQKSSSQKSSPASVCSKSSIVSTTSASYSAHTTHGSNNKPIDTKNLTESQAIKWIRAYIKQSNPNWNDDYINNIELKEVGSPKDHDGDAEFADYLDRDNTGTKQLADCYRIDKNGNLQWAPPAAFNDMNSSMWQNTNFPYPTGNSSSSNNKSVDTKNLNQAQLINWVKIADNNSNNQYKEIGSPKDHNGYAIVGVYDSDGNIEGAYRVDQNGNLQYTSDGQGAINNNDVDWQDTNISYPSN